jgi:large subunit ribosomal protein L10
MSKLVKRLVERDISSRLEGVEDAIIVNCIGMKAESTYTLRKLFREKGVSMLVVKRSLAQRASKGGPLYPAFEHAEGSVAIAWGGEDFVSLAKEIVAIDKLPENGKFEIKGGVMDGEALDGEQVKAISKWPNREEQIAMVVGQILAPGANLVSQILGPGSNIAGQIKTVEENAE